MSAPQDMDIGPLTWVKGEIDQALTKAAEALAQYTASVNGGNADLTQLKFCKTHLHQAHGALQIVGLDGVTKLSEEIEALVGKFETDPAAITVGNTAAGVNAMAAISRYLDELAQGAAHQPTRLFPAYQAVMKARGIDRFAESDLFFPDLSHRPPQRTDTVKPEDLRVYVRNSRRLFEGGLLKYLRSTGDTTGLREMLDGVRSIEATQALPQHRAFWWVTIGFIESLIDDGAGPTLEAKRLLARIDLQMKRLMEGSANVAEKLMRDALYFVAKSRGSSEQVKAIKAAYALAGALPEGQAIAVSLDPYADILRQVRESLGQAKDKWNKFSAGSKPELASFIEVCKELSSRVALLKQPDYSRLTQSLGVVAGWVAAPAGDGGGGKATESVALEVATALILCENAAESFSRIAADPAEFSGQVSAMTGRLKAAITGQTDNAPPVPALDEMSRRAQERLLMAQVAGEIQTNLRGIEQVLDTFFRDPEKREDLPGLQLQVKQVSGALMILQQDQAVGALQSVSADLSQFAAPDYVPQASDFERTAQTLSGLGFFVDALQYGPADFDSYMNPLKSKPRQVQAEVQVEMVPAPITPNPALALGLGSPASTFASTPAAAVANLAIDFPDISFGAPAEASAEDDFIKKAFDEAAMLAGLSPAAASSDSAPVAARLTVSPGPESSPPMTVELELEQEMRDTRALFEALELNPDDPTLKRELKASLKAIKDDADLVDDGALKAQAMDAMQLLQTGDLSVEVAQLRQAMPDIVLDFGAVSIAAPSAQTQALVDAPDDALDAEFLQIFLEEAQEVLVSIATNLGSLREEPSSKEYLTTVQRGFHTLKGSGRMVGLAHFGDVAESIEKTLKKWLEETRAATSPLFSLAESAGELFIHWVEDLATNGRSAMRGEPMIAAALRVREGGVFRLEAALDPPVALNLDLSDDSPTVTATVSSASLAPLVSTPPNRFGAEPDVDTLVLSQTGRQRAVALAGRSGPAATITLPRAPLVALDGDSDWLTATATSPSPPVPTMPPHAPAPAVSVTASAPALTPNALLAAGGAAAVSLSAAAIVAKSAEIARAAQAERAARNDTGLNPSATAAKANAGVSQPVMPAIPKTPETTVVIGEARVSPALYNIFVQEADSHLLTMRREMVRLEDAPDEIISESYIRAAHTLAGIAGTVNFAKLSELARQVELCVQPARKQSISLYQSERELLRSCTQSLSDMIDAVKSLRQPVSAEGLIAQLYNLKADLQERVPGAAVKPDWMRITQSMAALRSTQSQEVLKVDGPEELLPAEELLAPELLAPPTPVAVALSPAPAAALVAALEVTQLRIEPLTALELAQAEDDAVLLDVTAVSEEFSPTATAFREAAGAAGAGSTLMRIAAITAPAGVLGELGSLAAPVIRTPDLLLDSPGTSPAGTVLNLEADTFEFDVSNVVVPPDSTTKAATTPTTAPDFDYDLTDTLTTARPNLGALGVTSAVPAVKPFSEEDPPTAFDLLRAAASATPETPSPKATAFDEYEEFDRRTERIDDEIDEQLLPIFMEEALEIVPAIGRDLRAWQSDAADHASAQSLLRSLHTLKGSARMAGAMAMGQLTHAMESRIENAMELPQVPTAFFEELMTSYDRTNYLMDKLARYNPETARAERAAREARAAVEEAQDMLQVAPEMARKLGITQSLRALTQTQSVKPIVQNEPIAPLAATQGVAGAAAVTGAAVAASDEPKVQVGQAHDAAAGVAGHAVVMPAATPVNADSGKALLRVRADMIDRLVNQAGEVSIGRSRIEGEMRALKGSLRELTENVIRLRTQLREMEIAAESQMQSRMDLQKEQKLDFDPLEFDRFTRFQELTRLMAESVNDVATVQGTLLKNLDDADAALVAQGRTNRELQNDIMRVRMVPFATVAERLYRVVRQTAKELNKRANLDIRGGQAEIDRSVLERMTGPFEHLLRNSVAHGIESRETRLQQGKTELGEIALTVRQEGNEFVLVFADDGAGINVDRVRAKALAKGLMQEGDHLTDAQIAEFIFSPGFSTAETVSEISGRGVGMDVVRSEVAALGGRIDIDFKAGRGSTFSIYLPLTLAVTQVVLVSAGGAIYAFPSAMVEQVRQIKADELAKSYAKHSFEWQGRDYPLYFLPRLLNETEAASQGQRFTPILLLRSGAQRVAVHVDAMVGNQEVVVKNIGPQLARVTGISGATVLGSGQIVLILNAVQLMQTHQAHLAAQVKPGGVGMGSAAGQHESGALSSGATVSSAPLISQTPLVVRNLPTVMVVDDSLTVRKITTRYLSREGYRVVAAKDGVDALEQLQDTLPDVMLVDIEMPRMDGFDLTRNVRADERLRKIPIIMITSRTADKHRNYAREIGVNVFLGKPYQEDELLEHIAQFAKAVALA